MPERGETGLPYQEVAIGEEFFPFAHGESDNILMLSIEGIPSILVYFAGWEQAQKKFNSLTPYDIGAGYRISFEDFDPNKRREKLEAMKLSGEAEEYIYDGRPQLIIWAYTESEALEDIGVVRDTGKDMGDIFEIVPNFLASLRLQVKLPIKRMHGTEQLISRVGYEAKLDELSFRIGELSFENFYPDDTGPLATNEELQHGYHAYDGLVLCIPDDPEIRSQISFRFVLKEKGDK